MSTDTARRVLFNVAVGVWLTACASERPYLWFSHTYDPTKFQRDTYECQRDSTYTRIWGGPKVRWCDLGQRSTGGCTKCACRHAATRKERNRYGDQASTLIGETS